MMEYKEYYELFKQNPEWEVEHDNHKEGFNGDGNPDLDFWVCTTHALHDVSEHKQGLLDDGDYRLYFAHAEGPIDDEEDQGYLCDLPLNVKDGHFDIEEFEQILEEILSFEGAIEDTYYIEELIDNGRTYTEDGETFKVLDCSHNN